MRTPRALGLTAAAVVALAPALAQATPTIVPVLGQVVAATPLADAGAEIELQVAAGTAALRAVRRVATLQPDVRVSGHATDPERGTITVRFALAAAAEAAGAEVRDLHLTFDDGREAIVPVGRIAVAPRPAPAPDAPTLRWRTVFLDEGGGLFLAALLVNEDAVPVVVESLAYAPAGAGAARLLTRTAGAAPSPRAFAAWTEDVGRVVAEAWTPLAWRDEDRQATVADRGPRWQDLPARLDDGSAWRDPAALDLHLAPGAGIYLALTAAAYAEDVRDRDLWMHPILTVRRADGGDRSWRLLGPTNARHRTP